MIMALLVLFGGALAYGVLEPVTWTIVVATLVILFLVRPAAGFVGLLGNRVPWQRVARMGWVP